MNGAADQPLHLPASMGDDEIERSAVVHLFHHEHLSTAELALIIPTTQ